MLDSSPAAFFTQRDIPALIFGGARYFRAVVEASTVTGFTLSIEVADGVGPLFFFGSREEGNLLSDTTRWFGVDVHAQTSVIAGGDTVSFPTPTLTDGQWRRLALSFDQSRGGGVVAIRAFVDGAPAGTTQTMTLINGNGAPQVFKPSSLMIGAWQADPGRDNPSVPEGFFPGRMRNLRIWNTPLSDAQALFDTQTVFGREDRLVLALPLDGPHLNLASAQATSLTPGEHHADWVVVPDAQPSFGVANFLNFPLNDRTVEMWLRGGNGGSVFAYGHLGSSDPDNSAGPPWWITASGVPIDRDWHHLSVVVDMTARTQTTYIDGIKTSQTNAPDPLNPGQIVLLGAQWATDANDSVFTGQIRDVRVWSKARTAAQIARDAAGQLPDDWRGLAAEWPLTPDAPGADTSGVGPSVNFANLHIAPGQTLKDEGANLLRADVTFGGQPTHLIVSRRNSVTLVPPQYPNAPPDALAVPLDQSIAIFAKASGVVDALTGGEQGYTTINDGSSVTDPNRIFQRRFFRALMERSDELADSLYAAADAASSS